MHGQQLCIEKQITVQRRQRVYVCVTERVPIKYLCLYSLCGAVDDLKVDLSEVIDRGMLPETSSLGLINIDGISFVACAAHFPCSEVSKGSMFSSIDDIAKLSDALELEYWQADTY